MPSLRNHMRAVTAFPQTQNCRNGVPMHDNPDGNPDDTHCQACDSVLVETPDKARISNSFKPSNEVM